MFDGDAKRALALRGIGAWCDRQIDGLRGAGARIVAHQCVGRECAEAGLSQVLKLLWLGNHLSIYGDDAVTHLQPSRFGRRAWDDRLYDGAGTACVRYALGQRQRAEQDECQ